MKKLLLPLLLLLLGTGGGVATAMFVFPPDHASETDQVSCAPDPEVHAETAATEAEGEAVTDEDGNPTREYARLNNQFIVPVVENGAVKAMMVLSLSVEVAVGTKDQVFAAEPKLRDSFLQVLFDHANIGGFDGTFTSASNMRILRTALKDAAQKAVGNQISDVLIVDIARQDI